MILGSYRLNIQNYFIPRDFKVSYICAQVVAKQVEVVMAKILLTLWTKVLRVLALRISFKEATNAALTKLGIIKVYHRCQTLRSERNFASDI